MSSNGLDRNRLLGFRLMQAGRVENAEAMPLLAAKISKCCGAAVSAGVMEPQDNPVAQFRART